MYLEKAKAIYLKLFGNKGVGCTEEELLAAVKTWGRRFPLAFREYLLWLGRGSSLWTGSDRGFRLVKDPSWTDETRQSLI